MQRFIRISICLGIGGAALGFVCFADEVIPSAAAAVSLCLGSVIPSLLPFFVCSRMLLELGICEVTGRLIERPFKKLFRLPGVFAGGFLIGCISGFPTGAKNCASFFESGLCSRRQAAFGAILCNNAGPLFIIGTLGTSLLKNSDVGRQLWLIHLLSAILTAILFRFWMPNDLDLHIALHRKKKKRLLDLFSEAVFDSMQTLLQICGLIIFFNALIRTFLCLGLPENGLIIGGIEMTTGLSFLANQQPQALLPLCSFLLGFGGISVFMQVADALLPLGIPLGPYLLGKTIQGSIAAALTVVFYTLFPMPTPTFSSIEKGLMLSSQSPVLVLITLAILALALVVNRNRISRGSP